METIRNVRIVVNLESGKVDLKAPNLDAALKSTERHVKATQDLIREQEKLNSVQKSAPSGGGSSGGGSGTVTTLEQVLRLEKQIADEREKFMSGGGLDAYDRMAVAQDRLAASQDRLLQKSRAYYRQAFEGGNQAAEGFFRLGRAAVLLGASGDESFQKMIRGLMLVQAAFDIFRGTTQIVLGLEKAMRALAAAQALEAAAAGASATANTAAAGAMTLGAVAARGLAAAGTLLAAVFSPIAIVLATLAAVIYLCVKAWDTFTVSETEATEATEKQRTAVERHISAMERLATMQRSINDERRRLMSDGEQQADLFGQGNRQAASARDFRSRAKDFPGGEKELLESGFRAAERAAQSYQAAEQAAARVRDVAIEEREAKIKTIEAQEKLIDGAKRQYDIEQQKLRSFQAQFDQLSQFEQQQLLAIAGKLNRGENVNRAEEDYFAKNAGERGAGAINARRSKRGGAAGADEIDRLLNGVEGAGSGMKDASNELAKAVQEMAKLLAEIGKGATATEAKAQLEAEIKETHELYKKSIEETRKAAESNIQTMEALHKRIKELETAVQQGT